MERPTYKEIDNTVGTNRSKRAVSYIRVNYSSIGSSEAAEWDIEGQRAICGRIARQLGAIIVREYLDTCGAIRLSHPRPVNDMLADLSDDEELRPVDYVITRDDARLSRNFEDQRTISMAVKEAGARIATRDRTDAASAQGESYLSMSNELGETATLLGGAVDE